MQNFDELIERGGTDCYKYDWRQKIFQTDDVIPMWVADTDFKAPDFIMDAIQKRLQHGIFGYTFAGESYFESIVSWMKRRHNWEIKPNWIHHSPGVVPSLNLAVLALTQPGDEVIIQSPVYFPFYSAVENHHRKLLVNALELVNGRYEINFDAFEKLITNKTKLFILCSPHNPTGNVWKESELRTMANICLKHGITILSDEIHSDIVYNNHKHIPTAKLSEEISNCTFTLSSPSKTFNIAGFSSSFVITSNKKLFADFSTAINNLHIGSGNLIGLTASEAAYNHGDKWLEHLLEYYKSNINLVRTYVVDHLPEVTMINPESTYLIWLDFRKLGMNNKELSQFMIKKAGIGFSDGPIFGKEGSGFQRMNIGCPRAIVQKALEQIKSAVYD